MNGSRIGLMVAVVATLAWAAPPARGQTAPAPRAATHAAADTWVTVERPAPFGKDRDRRVREYDEKYGPGNWRLVWEVAGNAVGRDGIVMLYEDAYCRFLEQHADVLEQLLREASDVYDDAPSNVASGYDYDKQETVRTHLQDISIRRCVLRLGRRFAGSQLIQIRDVQGTHPLSITLSPGQVPFHMPALFRQPEATGWWKPGSVESFYQSNRVLQVKRPAAGRD